MAAALQGADAVIDVASVTTARRSIAVKYFETASHNSLGAAAHAQVPQHVVPSIVGADRVDVGYYEGGLTQERAATQGPVPCTVLRPRSSTSSPVSARPGARPVAVLPRLRIRPVAAREVGAELVRLAEGAPRGLGPEMAGPEEHHLVALARRVSQARGQRRPVLGIRLPIATGRQLTQGAQLPAGRSREGTGTFEQWLDRTARHGKL